MSFSCKQALKKFEQIRATLRVLACACERALPCARVSAAAVHAAVHAMPCHGHMKGSVPTGGLLVLSRTQVHALGSFDVLELPVALAVAVGGALGLSRAGGARVFPATAHIFFNIFTVKIT